MKLDYKTETISTYTLTMSDAERITLITLLRNHKDQTALSSTDYQQCCLWLYALGVLP